MQEEFLIDEVPLTFPRVVDAHVHVGDWPEFDLSFSIEDLELMMAQYGIGKAVVLPALIGDPLQANIDLLKRVKDDSRFYMFAWIAPRSVGLSETRELADWVRANVKKGIRGLKFHASIGRVGIYDDRIEQFLEIADRFELSFLYHAGRTPISWPDKLMSVSPSYPKVNFIMGHAGGTAYDRAVDTLRRWPTMPENVYAEISTMRWPDLMVRMVETWGEDRVLYGSDLPFVDLRVSWYALELSGLTSSELVMGGNLCRLLKVQ